VAEAAGLDEGVVSVDDAAEPCELVGVVALAGPGEPDDGEPPPAGGAAAGGVAVPPDDAPPPACGVEVKEVPLPGDASVPGPLVVDGVELDVDSLEAADVTEGGVTGLPRGVAVTVDGAPAAAGRPGFGVPRAAGGTTTEASRR
jgi:hypothetical protein